MAADSQICDLRGAKGASLKLVAISLIVKKKVLTKLSK